MKLFCKKTQNFRALGGLPPNPQPPGAGGSAPRPPIKPPIANFRLRAWLKYCDVHMFLLLPIFCLLLPILGEILNPINSLNVTKSSGFDHIPPFFVKLARPVISEPFSVLVNHSIRLGIFPEALKVAKVIPFHKSCSRHNPTNYQRWSPRGRSRGPKS